MNTPSANFTEIVRHMVALNGRDILRDRHFVNILRDRTRNEFRDETELFLLAVKSGAAEQVLSAKKISRKTAWKIALRFSAEYCVREDKAMETVCFLALLIRGAAPSAHYPYDENERLYMSRRERKPSGKCARENKTIVIRGGTFKNIDGETVTLSPYEIMEKPLSQYAYWSLTGDNPSYTVGGALPVDGVHWYAAVDFCNQKSLREQCGRCYVIDKFNPDPDNLAPLDLYRWKVTWLPDEKGWRLPTAAEWEYAYKTSTAFTADTGLTEWCWDFYGDLFGTFFYNNVRAAFAFDKQWNRLEKLCGQSAQGEGCCNNVNKNRMNHGKACFSYPGNYGFRLARSGT